MIFVIFVKFVILELLIIWGVELLNAIELLELFILEFDEELVEFWGNLIKLKLSTKVAILSAVVPDVIYTLATQNRTEIVEAIKLPFTLDKVVLVVLYL